MSTADVPSSNLYIPYANPRRLLTYSATGTGFTQTVNNTATLAPYWLILGCDIVASGAEPVQCFVNLQVPAGQQIYYDSQSTGEGLGVRFPYRGQVPVLPNESFAVQVSSSAAITWYATVWGLTWSGAFPPGW